MANIYVEGKGPKGVQHDESLAFAAVPAIPSRGLAVTYGADEIHAAVATVAGEACIGIIDEDIIAGLPGRIIELGQGVAQIGANVARGEQLATSATGQLVPAQPGQAVVAVALEDQVYVAPGSFACVFVVAILECVVPGSAVDYLDAAGAIPVETGTYALNGAAALAMTLAQPTAAQDGTTLYIVAATAHAHTVTTAADGIEGTKHEVTFAAVGDNVMLQAINGVWMVVGAPGGPTPAALA